MLSYFHLGPTLGLDQSSLLPHHRNQGHRGPEPSLSRHTPEQGWFFLVLTISTWGLGKSSSLQDWQQYWGIYFVHFLTDCFAKIKLDIVTRKIKNVTAMFFASFSARRLAAMSLSNIRFSIMASSSLITFRFRHLYISWLKHMGILADFNNMFWDIFWPIKKWYGNQVDPPVIGFFCFSNTILVF